MLHDQKQDFEAVFVNHGTDWPETYEYLDMLQGWLEKKGLPKITVLKPLRKIKTPFEASFDNLYDFCWAKKMFPVRMRRWCTYDFKVMVLNKYHIKPCFTLIGFAFDEAHRAKLSVRDGEELRYPLIEYEITRPGCVEIIRKAGLPVPPKSGCYICPFMRRGEIIKMRYEAPDLFCKLESLEKRNNEKRIGLGHMPYYSWGYSVSEIVNEKQSKLWETDEYPPCNCFL
jgi:hypothetical protein